MKTEHVSLVWLRPSKQIRAPLYSIKQKRQRRWIVIKYGIVFILAFALFAALVVIRESHCDLFFLAYTDCCAMQHYYSARA